MGCPAHTIVKEYHLYPEYKITETEAKSLKVHEIRQLKKTTAQAVNRNSLPDHFTQNLMWIQHKEWQQTLMTKN